MGFLPNKANVQKGDSPRGGCPSEVESSFKELVFSLQIDKDVWVLSAFFPLLVSTYHNMRQLDGIHIFPAARDGVSIYTKKMYDKLEGKNIRSYILSMICHYRYDIPGNIRLLLLLEIDGKSNTYGNI